MNSASSTGRAAKIRPRVWPRAWPRVWHAALPWATAALFLAFIAALLWILYRHDTELQRSQLLSAIQGVEINLTRELLDDQKFLDELARELSESGMSEATFRAAAEDYQRRRPAILAIVWNTPGGETAWVTPARRPLREVLRERPATAELERMQRLTHAMGRATYTTVYRDLERGLLIEYHTPVVRSGVGQGTLSITYHLQGLAQQLAPPSVGERYRLEFSEAGQAEPAPFSLPWLGDERLTQSIPVTLPWREVRLLATSFQVESSLAKYALGSVSLLLGLLVTVGLVFIRRQIRQRLEADAALRAEHERFITVLDAVDVAVYVADVESGELLYANEACLKLFGPAIANIRDVEADMSPAPVEAFPVAMLQPSAKGVAPVQKGEFQTRAGRWFLVRAKLVRWVDGRIARLHSAGDITDRKQAEDIARHQQKKLEQTSRLLTVGEMASTLAHEINQPLSAISNYQMGCVARLRSGHWDANELAETLEKASAQTERAGKVVQRVRDFLKNREASRSPVAVNDLVQEACRLVADEAEKAGIALEPELDSALPPVLADRIMVEQVLLNLLKNAMESMPAGGNQRLTVTTSRAADATVEVAVSDQGHGISADVEAELFAPFFTTKTEGLGMGLNICRSIIEMHEGRLWFTRNAAAGTTFRFTLPIAQ
ncbi:MAG: PAS domain S-box protein [Betaproteobacteria bacterium]|nr:PAS domain S-box protein [Betaproteobacteria bacterium]